MRVFNQSNQSNTIGFVPTMGALHTGHLSLVEASKESNDVTVASIFVNPTQFSAGEDFDKYPRQLEMDIEMLENAGVDCVFAPSNVSDIYPSSPLCHVEPKAFLNIAEGQARPEFFRGVATIVCKLFNIVRPTNSYFGQKDISQCVLIRRMVEDLCLPINVVVRPTLRADDGLALSSRNAYLTESERKVSSVLYKALSAGVKFCEDQSQECLDTLSRDQVIDIITNIINSEPLVTRIEYVSIASHLDMTELNVISPDKSGAVVSAAIRIGSVRLIDNLLMGRSHRDIFQIVKT